MRDGRSNSDFGASTPPQLLAAEPQNINASLQPSSFMRRCIASCKGPSPTTRSRISGLQFLRQLACLGKGLKGIQWPLFLNQPADKQHVGRLPGGIIRMEHGFIGPRWGDRDHLGSAPNPTRTSFITWLLANKADERRIRRR